jgi:hypothetical protein
LGGSGQHLISHRSAGEVIYKGNPRSVCAISLQLWRNGNRRPRGAVQSRNLVLKLTRNNWNLLVAVAPLGLALSGPALAADMAVKAQPPQSNFRPPDIT